MRDARKTKLGSNCQAFHSSFKSQKKVTTFNDKAVLYVLVTDNMCCFFIENSLLILSVISNSFNFLL